MTAAAVPAATAISDEELVAALERALRESTGETRRIRRLVRRSSSYQSSFPLEELTLNFDDGRQLNLIFKNVGPRALPSVARRAKPDFLADPQREINVYRTILTDVELGTPRFYGSVIDADGDRFWLFLENVAGQELYQIGNIDLWFATARWLARFHSRFSRGDGLPQDLTQSLIRYDESYYALWFDRAAAFARETSDASRLAAIQRLGALAPRIVAKLLELPTTLIHGEFYASNIVINDSEDPSRVCPLDWERAAIGPGLIDLAALTAGNWPEQAKVEMALAYRDELLCAGDSPPSRHELLRGLNLCRLHLAVQWLGWSADWTPPKDHRQDWLAEALYAASQLSI
jgi:hypothetical protein